MGRSRVTQPATVAYAFLDLQDGGAQRLTLEACRRLDPRRYRPVIVCMRGDGLLVAVAEAAGLDVHCLARLRRSRDLGAVAVAADWMRRHRPDVVHVQLYSRASPYARAAALLAGVPLVVCHEWCRAEPPGRARTLADRWLGGRVLGGRCRYVAASHSLSRDLMAQGIAGDRIAVVHAGIDTDRFAAGDRGDARRSLGLDEGSAVLLVPARLHPMKGHVDLLAALPRVLAHRPDVCVLVAGAGPLAETLPALARAAGVDEHVRFLGHRDDMPRLLAASDIVVLPSHIEGLPSAIMEAMAARRPIVATKVGGVEELMPPGIAGWVVPPRDPGGLADAIVAALSDPGEASRRAERGREAVEASFRADQATQHLQAVYDRWLGRTYPAEEARTPAAVIAAPAAGITASAAQIEPPDSGATTAADHAAASASGLAAPAPNTPGGPDGTAAPAPRPSSQP